MADWKTYAKAARNTARRQGPEFARQAREAGRRSSVRAGDYARAARKAADEGTRESRQHAREDFSRRSRTARRDAAAYAVVAERRARAGAEYVRGMSLGRRLLAALRDALLFGVAIFVIWFVISRAGLQIPVSALLGVIGVLMIIRFGYALFAKRDSTIGQGPLEEEPEETREREYDPRAAGREHREHEVRREREDGLEREPAQGRDRARPRERRR